jgi:hypothetical protein
MVLSKNNLVLIALFVVEIFVFRSQFKEQIDPYYPLAFDQTSFFLLTYNLVEGFFLKGWGAFGSQFGSNATGATFPMQAAFLALIGGVSRASMLALNLVYFLLLQSVLFWTVRNKTRGLPSGWIAISLVLSLSSVFNVAGGIYDFRIDFSAMCLYGMWICALLNSNSFTDIRWSLVAGFVGALLVSMRFITLTYVGSLAFLLFVVLAIRAWRIPSVGIQQVRNSFISGCIILFAAGPFLVAAREHIFEYYGTGHLFGSEGAVRAAEFGVRSKIDHLLFYPKSLLHNHLGPVVWWIVCVVLIVSCLMALTQKSSLARSRFDRLLLGLSIFIPLFVLTLDISKSPVVGGIVSIPMILAVSLLAGQSWPSLAGRTMSSGVLAIGLLTFLSHANTRQHYLSDIDLLTVNRLNEVIAEHIVESATPAPKIAFDRLDDYLNANTISLLKLWRFQREHPTFLNLNTSLGTNVLGVDSSAVLSAVQASDIVVITDGERGRGGPYPFDKSMKENWLQIASFAKQNLFSLVEEQVRGIPYRVFVRAPIRIDGLSGDWVSSSGLVLSVERRFLREAPFIELVGRADQKWLSGDPGIKAEEKIELPVSYKAEGDQYRIIVDARAAIASDLNGIATINLSFKRYFIPKAMGINEDTRKLVISAPTNRTLLRSSTAFNGERP